MRWLKVVLMMLLMVNLSFASEVERLVEKLVEKGIITEGEAYKILTEAEEEAKKQEAVARKDTDKISGWIKNTKFKGDARLRYEYIGRENQDGSYIADRERWRIRFRWGFDTKVNDQIEAGFRIATGDSQDPTSANQTLTQAFNDKYIWLDKAYITYKPVPTLSITGGKMTNPFYTNLIWSSDLNPEGVSFVKNFPVDEGKGNFYLLGGYFPILERSNDIEDPYMTGFQIGYAGKIQEKKFKAAIAYYDYNGIKDSKASEISPSCYNKGNTLYGSGTNARYKYDYDILDLSVEFTPFEFNYRDTMLPLTFYGDYGKNIAAGVKENIGYLYGFQLGSAKKQKSWQFNYDYRRLEADAVVEFMPDDSFAQGGTDCKGHTLGFRYATSDNSTLGITYMITEGLGNTKKVDADILQIDYSVSF